jgi:hypothetical protein
MKHVRNLLILTLATVFLTGCYTELAVLNTSDAGYNNRTRDFISNDQDYYSEPSSRTYTTNPNAENGYYADDQENGVFIDYNNVPASEYLGVNPDITNRELAELIVQSNTNNNDVRNLGCDPLFFDPINCRNDFLFRPGFSFNRFGIYNGLNNFMYPGQRFWDPFWASPGYQFALFGTGFGFFYDPFLSPFAFNWHNGLFLNGWNPYWNNNPLRLWANNGVFVPVNQNTNENIASSGRASRGSDVGRSFIRDRSDARNTPKIDNSRVRSARTTSSSSISGLRNSYTSTTGVSRGARTPSNSRLSAANALNNRSSTYRTSSGRRSYYRAGGTSSARSSSYFNTSTARNSNSKYNNSTYRTNSSGSSYAAPRSSSVGSRSSSTSRSSTARSSSSSSSSSRGSSTSRGKRGNN